MRKLETKVLKTHTRVRIATLRSLGLTLPVLRRGQRNMAVKKIFTSLPVELAGVVETIRLHMLTDRMSAEEPPRTGVVR